MCGIEYAELPGLDKPVSRLVQGTLMLARVPADSARALLDAVYEAGCRTFDTAPVYGKSLAERRLGAWLSERGIGDAVIVDKGGHPRGGKSRVAPPEVEADLTHSLESLGVQRIDLYLLHRDQPDIPVDELVDYLNLEVARGRITCFGASNWSARRIEQANRYAKQSQKLGFVVSSPEYNLAVPVTSWSGCLSIAGDAGAAERAWYEQSRLPVMAWSPLAGGFLTGAYTRDTVPASDRERRVLEFYASSQNFERLARLRELANTKGQSLASLALAYVMSSPMNVFATLGCASGAEFSECARAAKLALTADEMRWLEAGAPAPHHFSKL